jgi:hypothetical protein
MPIFPALADHFEALFASRDHAQLLDVLLDSSLVLGVPVSELSAERAPALASDSFSYAALAELADALEVLGGPGTEQVPQPLGGGLALIARDLAAQVVVVAIEHDALRVALVLQGDEPRLWRLVLPVGGAPLPALLSHAASVLDRLFATAA